MKRIIQVTLALALVALLGATLWYLYRKSEKKAVVYATVQPMRTTIVKKTVATGAVVPRREIAIKPQVSGIVEKLYVQAGDRVKKGDMIARVKIIPNMLSLSNAESRLNRARLAYDNARLEFDRNQELFRTKIISQAEFQPYRLAYDNAREELDAAENNLQVIREGTAKTSGQSTNTIVRSTIDGMVLDVPVKEGSSVIESNTFNEGTTVATVADMGEMIFEGKLDESEVGKIKAGMELILSIGAIDTKKFKAYLEYIAPKGIKENGAIQFTIKARVDLEKGFFIRAGYSANADIVLDRKENVLAISEGVVQFEDDRTFVEVDKGNQQFEKRPVKLGISDGINVEVLDGVGADDHIKDPGSAGQAQGPVTSGG